MKGWQREPMRHSLASKGISTQANVYVGAQEEPTMSGIDISKTDIPGAFHTSLEKDIAFYFADQENKDYIYRLNLDYSHLPKEKVLREEDWTMEMTEKFAKTGRIDLNELEKTNPEVAKFLKEDYELNIYNDELSAHDIGRWTSLSVFFYPPKELVDNLSRSDRGTLNEQEVAILDRDYLRKIWRDRERIHKSEVENHG